MKLKKRALRIILFILGIFLGLLVLYRLYLNFQPEIKLLMHFDPHNEKLLIKMVRSHGIEDLAFLFILNVVCVAIPGLSNGIFCVLNGILYGPAIGFGINWVGDVIGQFVLMQLLRKLYNPDKLKHSKIYTLLMSAEGYQQIGLIFGYMIPFIPSATVSYANLLINKTRKKRLIPILIGTIPFAYLYAYGGDSILHLDGQRLIKAGIAIIVIALLAILFVVVTRKFKKHKK
ncbi:TVP38/TMEM64 family protein [Lactobacillus intestinalis]|uniref:TVP38/TMEM64 family membrane protein n=1 Tax=Lactobacillus intestinalis TaxID=151781 RepID=A0A4V3REC9_9LACO|nr:VTT domain-containing protein [Lactobacillus intestinalis]TGY16040.1 TVP38/TMEM64 family protein [Lactobacillus intestinalis]